MKEFLVPSLAIPVGSIWRDLQEKITAEKEFFVSSPLSNTPLPVYQWILEHANTFTNWEKVRFVLMDEMVEGASPSYKYIPVDDLASYEAFARKNMLHPLEERTGTKIPLIKPDLSRLDTFYTEIDLLILALGIHGNYANVMPGISLDTGWHISRLSDDFRQVHTQSQTAAYRGATFREYGMSLGPKQVLAARHIVVIVSGEQKKPFLRELKQFNAFNPAFPLSIIYHPEISKKVEMYITPEVL